MKPFIGVLVSCALGLIGGPFVAWPMPVLGLFFGPLFAMPVGLASGVVCAVMNWPIRVVWVACLGQFIGALTLGFAFYFARGDYPSTYAFEGEVIGAALGLLVGRYLFGKPDDDGETRCSKCGYNLRGLRDSRCPECGTPFELDKPEKGHRVGGQPLKRWGTRL